MYRIWVRKSNSIKWEKTKITGNKKKLEYILKVYKFKNFIFELRQD